MAGLICCSANFSSRCRTLVDSALAGKNDELSFFWTSETLPCNEPSGPPTMSQTRTMSAGRSHRSRLRPVEGSGLLPAWSLTLDHPPREVRESLHKLAAHDTFQPAGVDAVTPITIG